MSLKNNNYLIYFYKILSDNHNLLSRVSSNISCLTRDTILY